MRVVGKYKTVYECDSVGKTKDGEGSVYAVKGRPNYKVKIFDRAYCTKSKEQEINSAMCGEMEWYGPQIMDMVYSHGKFTGYLYEEEQIVSPEPIYPDEPNDLENLEEINKPAERKKTGWTTEKILYIVGITFLLGALTYFVFFDVYLDLINGAMSPEIAGYCYTFNFYGITGIIGGLITVVLSTRFLKDAQEPVYYIGVPIAYLLGMVTIFLVVTLVIVLISIAISVLVSLIPTIIVVVVIVYVIKSMFRRR